VFLNILKNQWKPFLWTNFFFFLYNFVFIAWSDYAYINDDDFPLILVPLLFFLYSFLHVLIDLEKWDIFLYIPWLPFMFYSMMTQEVYYRVFPYPNPEHEDLGAGFTMMIIGFYHYIIVTSAISFAKWIKKRRHHSNPPA